MRLKWSSSATRIPDSLNSQLLGTFPAVVQDEDGITSAFFVRAAKEEFSSILRKTAPASCLLKPKFVKTPQGPLVVAYCMLGSTESAEPFISETALFPGLSSLPSHREIVNLLLARSEAYYVVCDAQGRCMFNSKARILSEWRSELAQNANGFNEGKQITDEKTAIMSLYWYQERHNPSSKIFEVSH